MNLRLLQISDSALPIGGYTHSWGLETALARGLVVDAATLEVWVRSWLRFGLGPCEGVVTASACRAARTKDAASLRRASEILRTSINPPSVRAASREMGEQLLSLAQTWQWSESGVQDHIDRPGGALPPAPEIEWHHAVVFGLLGALAGATPGDTLAAYLHQAALGMIGAALRAAPIGHTHGQQVLAYLHSDIETLAEELVSRDLETAGSGCPFHEILCDEQTHLYTRLFRS